MGMMLRRHKRTPEYAPTVNGKPVQKDIKKRSLTEQTKTSNTERK